MREAGQLLQQCEAQRPAQRILTQITDQEDCCCGHKGSPTRFSQLDTGVTTILNNVCAGCVEGQKMDQQLARVVCYGCRKVVMRVSPSRDADGFVFKAGQTYHTNACPACQKGVEASMLVEKVIWMKKQGRAV